MPHSYSAATGIWSKSCSSDNVERLLRLLHFSRKQVMEPQDAAVQRIAPNNDMMLHWTKAEYVVHEDMHFTHRDAA